MALVRLSGTAGLSESALVKNTVRLLSDVPYTDVHSNSLDTSTTTLTVPTDATTRWEAGDTADWLADGTYEAALVTATAATALTIRRGYLDTTAAAHATNAVVRKNPRFLAHNAQKAVQDAISDDLYPAVYAVYEQSATASAERWHNLEDATAEEIIHAYQKLGTSPVQLVPLRVSQPAYVDSTIAANKRAVYIESFRDATATFWLQFLRPPTQTDLSSAQARIVEYGAARRLLDWEGAEASGKEAAPGAAPPNPIRDSSWFERQQGKLITQEKALLDRRWRKRRRNFIGPMHVGDYRGAGEVGSVGPASHWG